MISRGRSSESIYSIGVRDGKSWRRHKAAPAGFDAAGLAAHRTWSKRARKRFGRNPAWTKLLGKGKRYMKGFRRGARKAFQIVPVPLRGTAAAVLYAPRREESMRRVLRQLRKLPLDEIIVVMHDASAASVAAAREEPGVLVAHFPDVPDADVGRALGAKLARADSVLFVDGDRPIKAELLAHFLWACDRRLDVALNDVSRQLGLFHRRQDIFRLAEFLNTSLHRSDLAANSLSFLPFALSRRALDTLDPLSLAIPAKAHTAAILGGLRVAAAANAPILHPANAQAEAQRLVKTAGHLAEALRDALSAKGDRLRFADVTRNRSVMEEWKR